MQPLNYVSDSYEDLFYRADRAEKEGDNSGAAEAFERLWKRLSSLKPEMVARRNDLELMRQESAHRLTLILFRLEQFEEAYTVISQMRQSPGGELNRWAFLAGQCLIELGQGEKGLDELRARAMAEPANYESWLLLGFGHYLMNQMDEAVKFLTRSLETLDPHDKTRVMPASYLFDVYWSMGDWQKSLQMWRLADGLVEAHNSVVSVVTMLIDAGQYAEAQQLLKKAKNKLIRIFYAGWIAQKMGDEEKARAEWQKLQKINPQSEETGHEAWGEGMLRLNEDPHIIADTMRQVLAAKGLATVGYLVWAAAEGRAGHKEDMAAALKDSYKLFLPSQRRIYMGRLWPRFKELAADESLLEEAKPYFYMSGKEG